MVPQFKGAQALEFQSKFLQGEDYLYYDSTCTSPTTEESKDYFYDEKTILFEIEKGKNDWAVKERDLNERLKKIREIRNS
jgi:hypothetical protein